MALFELYAHDDVFLEIVSFLPLCSIAMMERSCRKFLNLLRENYIDKTIYFREINQFIPIVLDEFKRYLMEEASCRELLRGFYHCPLKLDSSSRSRWPCVKAYDDKGGPILFNFMTPCKLLQLTMKYYRGNVDALHVRRLLHKIVLMAGTSWWNFKDGSIFCLAHSDSMIEFGIVDEHPQELFSFEPFSIGKGLRMMLTDFPDHGSEFPLVLQVKDNRRGNIVIYSNSIRNAEPEEGWSDIFQSTCNPPHDFQSDPTTDIEMITKEIYNNHNGSCEHYSWDNFIVSKDHKTWSEYWIDGMHWWGTFGLTTYDYEKEHFVVATASENF